MNKRQINEELIPSNDKIFLSFGKVSYKDRFCLSQEAKKEYDVNFIIFKIISSPPKWIKLLLSFRNSIARVFGLKTGKIEKNNEKLEKLNIIQGHNIGDFLIILKEKNSIIIELNDKHLDFRFAIFIRNEKYKTKIYLTTIVKINNLLGKIYFFLITPFHRLIIPIILKKVSKSIYLHENNF